ncbi:efflux RND transporter periplasmic adaptor subunit [Sphingomonas aracearum]|uniref:Efflux RND transporter periplasmic adaptor subunit n=1 Tax=Sphingomonas aracearum TaxID=2283317 RepID=A0A369VY96_9SPHN|nr:efflux RND transporter periplasmic adaptor subunit [Sphingomonas aracearum]RDE07374.1 efflux RND transporter periplasmic adaptor subunit [Sphingomonas aracearum]
MRLIGMFAICGVLAGCGERQAKKPAAAPAPVVEVETVRSQDVPNLLELPGRIQSVRTAEVRARVDGIVQRRLFQEGSDVRAGQPLFQIDPRAYRAQVEQALAVLRRAQAARTNAASVVSRYAPLVRDRSVSGQENDAAVSDLRQAEAQVAEARAQLAQRRLDLEYTTVRAPISGRVGIAEVTEGALVSGGQATLLTRVDEATPIYAVFSQSNTAILDAIAQQRSGSLQLRSSGEVRVALVLDNGQEYPVEGKIDFTAPTVDAQTGTRTIRAVFANPQRLLQPGQFVRGRIRAGMLRDGVTVPARAIQFKGAQASVMTVNAQNVVVARPVKLGAEVGNRWIVPSGLKNGERVIVNGWQKARPGQQVKIAPRSAATPAGGQPTAPRS